MTLNGIMAAILRYFTEFGSFGTNYVEMVEDSPYCLQQKCSPKNLVVSNVSLTAIFAEVTENECINKRHLHDKEYIDISVHRCSCLHDRSDRTKVQKKRSKKQITFVFDYFGRNITAEHNCSRK